MKQESQEFLLSLLEEQKNKELLLKDLTTRLNTNLVCSIYRTDDEGVGYRDEILHGYCKGDIWYEFYFREDCSIGIDDVSKIKPYLFPLSSMSEEQCKELEEIDPEFYSLICSNGEIYVSMDLRGYDWLNENHFDYRGLIQKGLALNATGLNIY
jgi:hypothetical protein